MSLSKPCENLSVFAVCKRVRSRTKIGEDIYGCITELQEFGYAEHQHSLRVSTATTDKKDARRQVLEEGLEEVKAVLVVRLALAQVLEDSQHGRDLTGSNDLLSAATEERAQEAHEGGDVAPALPQRRREEGRENGAVHVGQAGRNGVQLEELGEDLKDEGSELGNVLREDGLEGGEEGTLESRERGGVASGDEAGQRLMHQLRLGLEE